MHYIIVTSGNLYSLLSFQVVPEDIAHQHAVAAGLFQEDFPSADVDALVEAFQMIPDLNRMKSAFGSLANFCTLSTGLPFGVGAVMAVACGLFSQLHAQTIADIESIILAIDVALIMEILHSISCVAHGKGFEEAFWQKAAGKLHLAMLRLVGQTVAAFPFCAACVPSITQLYLGM